MANHLLSRRFPSAAVQRLCFSSACACLGYCVLFPRAKMSGEEPVSPLPLLMTSAVGLALPPPASRAGGGTSPWSSQASGVQAAIGMVWDGAGAAPPPVVAQGPSVG